MERRIDLANPDFEPSDEELTGLSRRAFAGVGAAHEDVLRRLRAQIDVQRAEVLRALDAKTNVQGAKSTR
jgi:hypothetical protein